MGPCHEIRRLPAHAVCPNPDARHFGTHVGKRLRLPARARADAVDGPSSSPLAGSSRSLADSSRSGRMARGALQAGAESAASAAVEKPSAFRVAAAHRDRDRPRARVVRAPAGRRGRRPRRPVGLIRCRSAAGRRTPGTPAQRCLRSAGNAGLPLPCQEACALPPGCLPPRSGGLGQMEWRRRKPCVS